MDGGTTMKIDLASTHQILVELDAADLGAFRLTVEQLGAPDDNTRRMLQQILSAASDESGYTYRLRQYSNVDVLPDKVGGCLLILSDYEKRRTRKEQCFFCASFNALVDLARTLGAKSDTLLVTLLQTNAGFLLLTPEIPDATNRLFREYLEPMVLSDAAKAVICERSEVLLASRPLSTLGGGAQL